MILGQLERADQMEEMNLEWVLVWVLVKASFGGQVWLGAG